MTLARTDGPSLRAESEMSTFSPATPESGPESVLKNVCVLNSYILLCLKVKGVIFQR